MPAPDGISKILRAIVARIISRPSYAHHLKREHTGSVLMTGEKLGSLLVESSFMDLDVEVKERKVIQPSAKGLIEFYSASTFGNFLDFMPEELRDELKQEIVNELEKQRTAEGIELLSRTIFAIARKPK